MSWIWPVIADESRAIAVTQPAFWASLVVAGIAFFDPVVGPVLSVLFTAIALGIRAKKVAAATAGLLCLAATGVHSAYWLFAPPIPAARVAAAQGLLLLVPVGVLFLRSLRALQRFHELRASPRSARKALTPLWALVPLLVALIVIPVFVAPYGIPSRSMAHTLEAGDLILAERVSGWMNSTPKRGDIVLFQSPTDQFEMLNRRVIGMPGDRIQIIHKELWINRAQAREPYVVHTSEYLDPYRDNFPEGASDELPTAAQKMIEAHVVEGELVVPEDSYFVLGDNRDHSLDSRYFGFLKQEHILGSPLLVYWSTEQAPTDTNPDTEPGRIRWSRIPTVIRNHELTTK